MANQNESLSLGPSDLAFLFETELGVEAQDLGVFLQRASTVARRAGGDLYVTAFSPGSLAVITRVLRRGVRASVEEFRSSPIRTTSAIVGLVSAALAASSRPHGGIASPLAKAGAGLVEKHQITQISLVSINKTEIIMDERRAELVRDYTSAQERVALPMPDIRRLIDSAEQGDLTGRIIFADHKLYFKPDGYRYLVPVQLPADRQLHEVKSDARLIIWGEILLRDLQPDLLVIKDAKAL